MSINVNDPQDVLTISQVAERLGICEVSAYRAARRGEIPVLRLGSRILVPRAAFNRWLETAGANLAEIGSEDPVKTSAKQNNLAALASQEARETHAKGKGGAR